MKSLRRVVWVGLLALSGCGKGEPAPATPATNAAGADAAAQPPAPVGVPSAAVDPHQLDPAKQVLPATPVSGRLNGKPFEPTVTYASGELAFRRMPTAAGESESSIVLKVPVGTAKFLVQPDRAAGDAVPRIDTFTMLGDKPNLQSYLNGYGLTLELGTVSQGKVSGKIALALPDDAKSWIAGTFTADVLRLPGELPSADEAPYLQGTIAYAGERTGELEIGRIAAPGGSVTVENVSLTLEGAGPRLTRAESPKPSAAIVTASGELRYEHTRLTPGRTLIWAKLSSGPATWKWVTVGPDTKADVPLTLDAKAQGSAKVKLPKDVTGVVRLLPVDDDAEAEPIPETALAFALKLEAAPNAGSAAFPMVPAGNYRVTVTKPGEALAFLSDAIAVVAGKETALELKARD